MRTRRDPWLCGRNEGATPVFAGATPGFFAGATPGCVTKIRLEECRASRSSSTRSLLPRFRRGASNASGMTAPSASGAGSFAQASVSAASSVEQASDGSFPSFSYTLNRKRPAQLNPRSFSSDARPASPHASPPPLSRAPPETLPMAPEFLHAAAAPPLVGDRRAAAPAQAPTQAPTPAPTPPTPSAPAAASPAAAASAPSAPSASVFYRLLFPFSSRT